MLLNSEGIVLQTTKYGETSLISKVVSEEKGLVTLISSRSKSKKNRSVNFFQPLSAIQFVCYISNKSDIFRVKEVSFNTQINTQINNPSIDALRFFLAEILSRVIREEEQNFTLYQFIKLKLIELNSQSTDLGSFHINFLIELFDHLGIQPNLDMGHNYFDLQEGSTVSTRPMHGDFCENNQLELLFNAFNKEGQLSKLDRSRLLNLLLEYCNIQLGGSLKNLKSKAVLEVVFS